MLKIDVYFTRAAIRAQEPLTVGLVGAKVSFSFDATWKPLGKIAVFRQGAVTKDAAVVDGPVTIPWEVLQQPGVPVEIGVYGTDGTGKRVIPTLWVRTEPVRPAAQPVEDPSLTPTPEVWEQVMARVAGLGDSGVHVGTEEPTDPRANVWIDPEGDFGELSVLKVKASGTWQPIPAIKGDPGYTPVRGKDYFTEEDQKKLVSHITGDEAFVGTVKEAVKAEVPLVRAAEQPGFVNSTKEMTDKSKVYVMNGSLYAYRETAGENYNLLKTNGTGEEKINFTSKLSDTSSDVSAALNSNNAVTGWFPVTYGKYYAFSIYAADLKKRTHLRTKVVRVQLKTPDGIKVYAIDRYPQKLTVEGGFVYGIDDANATSMRMQIQVLKLVEGTGNEYESVPLPNADNLKAFEPMIVEGDTVAEAYSNAVNLAYLDGDEEIETIVEWYNTGLAYQPADYDDRIIELESDVSDLKNGAGKPNADLEKRVTRLENWDKHHTYEAQKRIAYDWRIPFIDVFNKNGLGSKHVIPGSYGVWGGTGNDLTQKEIMMEDGMHPETGDGVTKMYAQAIIPQLRAIPPLYAANSEHDDWTGKRILWMGTSCPAGSDPALGLEGSGTTYPAITASALGATCTNIARGSSCVRVNASTGEYNNFAYHHFLRSLSRTTAEADKIRANWATIKPNITSAAGTISDSDLAIMKAHSFENLLLPYLNGTKPMPDLFVFDHGHNDRRPVGVDGEQDLLVAPTLENITNGTLAEDTYMTANNYANLKLAFNNDLSKIGDVAAFAASVNRNCFIGAMNFMITLIYRYNPKARIAIISDYD